VSCFKGCGARFKWQQGGFYDPFHKNSYTFYKNTYSFLTFALWCHVSRVVVSDSSDSRVHSMRILTESIHFLLEYWFRTQSFSYTFYKNTYSFLTFALWCHALWYHVSRVVVSDSNDSRVDSMRILTESRHFLLEYWLRTQSLHLLCGDIFKGLWCQIQVAVGPIRPFHKNSYTIYKNTYSFLPFVLWWQVPRVVPWQVPRVVPFYRWIHTLSIRILT
jgi:hypothetical protein